MIKTSYGPTFKGWTKPGPSLSHINDSTQSAEWEPGPDESFDALCGHFRIYQLKKGHRYSTDDILTAWYGALCCPSASTILDLGSGIGSVGMTVAWKFPGAKLVTIEAQDPSVALARKSIAFNELESRYEIRHGDFRTPGILREDERFDLICGSPPYFPLDAGILGNHPQKVACRFEVRGTVADYCAVAAQHLSPGGVFACIFPVNPKEQENRVIEGAKAAGLTIIRKRNIILKEGNPPLLGVFAMSRSEDLPEEFRNSTWEESPLIIRRADGTAHPEYSRVKLTVGLPPHS